MAHIVAKHALAFNTPERKIPLFLKGNYSVNRMDINHDHSVPTPKNRVGTPLLSLLRHAEEKQSGEEVP